MPDPANTMETETAATNRILVRHHARIEAKTDAFLAATERQIAALRDLKHTAIWIAAGLIVAGYLIAKVL